MEQSRLKLKKALELLKPLVAEANLHISPCASDDDTLGYRCKCSFQLVRNDTDDGQFQYAIRQGGQPIAIQAFPVANERIQRVMRDFLAILDANEDEDDVVMASALTKSLSSISFASSWSAEKDCVVTCNYDDIFDDPERWKHQARSICHDLGLTQLLGRSRKCMLAAFPHEPVLRDQIVMNKVGDTEWNVQLVESDTPSQGTLVEYEKPESAFYHPNARAMLEALKWQLERVSRISHAYTHRKPALLELYCGCGAHTVALAKSDMFESIVAVELDQRLVDKCQRNIQLNQLDNVCVISKDAAVWADMDVDAAFDVVLVDPPKQGLGENVCRLIIRAASCRDMLYISCGYEALARDLQLLGAAFDVVDCTIIDLFPTMEGVESLVHLRRRSAS